MIFMCVTHYSNHTWAAAEVPIASVNPTYYLHPTSYILLTSYRLADQTEQISHLRTELAQIASFMHAYPPSPNWKTGQAPAGDGPAVMTGSPAESEGFSGGSPEISRVGGPAAGGGPPRRSCQRLDA